MHLAQNDQTAVITQSLDSQLGSHLEPVFRDGLVAFLVSLRAWNRVHNLTAIRDLHEQVRRHLVEPVMTMRSFPSEVLQAGSLGKPLRVLDVGSGAGVPAIPWAIMTASVCHFTLVEKAGKKAAFLRRVVHQLNLNSRVTVIEEDVRKLEAQEPYDMICSRAFASLADFIQWTQHLLRPQGFWLYLAGQLDRIAGLKEQHYQHPKISQVVRLVNISPVQLQGQTSSHLVWLSKEGTAC
jgi:16S rRNA (guanine527-N7)-methyltransferase